MSSPPSNPVEFGKKNSPGHEQILSKDDENLTKLPENETQKSILTKASSETPVNPSTSKCNFNQAALTEGDIKQIPSVSKKDDSAGEKGESMSVDVNNDNNDLVLRYEGDDEDILDEDALLAGDMELEMGEVIHEEDTSDLQNASEIINDTASIDKVSVPTDLEDDFVEVEKESNYQNNKPLVKGQDLSGTEEFQKETKMEIDLNISDCPNLSAISQKSSFEPLNEHGLNKPDMMLEIPTQEIIEFSDEDDDDLGCNTLTLSPDIKDVNLAEKNVDFVISKQNIDCTYNSAKCSTVIDTNILADSKVNVEVVDPKPHSDLPQTTFDNLENSEDVNMEVLDAPPYDPTTNALIYEAELAADIITKEMHGLEDNSAFINEDDVIQHVNKEVQELSSPLKSNLSNPSDKEISEMILEESALLERNSDVIELSDDSEGNENGNLVTAPELNPNNEVQKLNNALLEEDILNDTQEIDKLLLSKKTVAKDCDNLDTNSVKSNTMISENTKVLENLNEFDIVKHATKIDAVLTKIVAMETDEIAITTGTAKDLSLLQDTPSPKMKLSLSPENVETLTPESKSEYCTSQGTMLDGNASSQLDSQTASKLNTVLPLDDQTAPNMADTLLSTNLKIDTNTDLTPKSTEDEKTAASESIENDNENKISMIEDPASSKTCTVISDKNEENISKSIDVADLLSESNLKLTLKDIPEKQAIKIPEPVDESMEIDDIQQSSEILEPKICEGGELQLSNIEPKISETVKPQLSEETKQNISDIIEIEPQPNLSSLEPKILENNEPQPEPTAAVPLSSNIETETTTQLLVGSLPQVELNTLIEQQLDNKMLLDQKTSKIMEPQLKLSNDEPKISEIIEQKQSTSNIEPKTSEIVESQPSVEPKILELHLPTSLEQKLPKGINVEPNEKVISEIIEPPTLTSKIDAEKDVALHTTFNIAVQKSGTVEPQPFNVEPKTSNIVESPPSVEPQTLELQFSTTLKPKVSDIIEPQLNLSTLVLKVLKENIKPSTSKTEAEVESVASTINIEAQTSKAVEPLPSTSKCDAEPLNPKPNSPKNIEAFDSLIQDSSDDVPETTDSLGLLAESSRVVEDDEEHDDDEYVEDEDDFEPDDENSNQMMADNSEDSSAQHSETEVPKDPETPDAEKQEFSFQISSFKKKGITVTDKERNEMICDEGKMEEEAQSEDIVRLENDEVLNTDKLEDESELMEVETMKLSDTSDTEDADKKEGESVLEDLLLDKTPRKSTDSEYETKTRKLSISQQNNVMSYVDLGESSSDEDKHLPETKPATGDVKEDIVTDDASTDVPHTEPTGDIETSASPQEASPVKDETSLKETDAAKSKSPPKDSKKDPTSDSKETKARSLSGLEVFNLDSDDEPDDSSMMPSADDAVPSPITEEKDIEEQPKAAPTKPPPKEQPKKRKSLKCINRACTTNDMSVPFYVVDTAIAFFFEADKKIRSYVCEPCVRIVEKRNQELIDGIRNSTPLYQLHTSRNSEELVEISDSDSDEEPEPTPELMQVVGAEGAKMLEEQLADMINETWDKYKMDHRIEETRHDLQKEIDKLKKEGEEIDALFNECQAATDRLRNSLYASFEADVQELPPVIIFDMPNCSVSASEPQYSCLEPPADGRRSYKRRLSPSIEAAATSAKKPATPARVPAVAAEVTVGTTQPEPTQIVKLGQEATSTSVVEKSDDDNMDISVVQLSAEAAPPDLPPPGELSHPPVKLGMTVYAMKNAFGTWHRAKVVEIQPKTNNQPFTMVRVRFEHKVTKNPFKTLPARCLAYFEPSDVRMVIGTRVIALFSSQQFYSGIVAEIPNPVNKYRYLIFFDDGYAQYAKHSETRLVCEFSSLVWEEVHSFSRDFVKNYLISYPERPMVRLHAGQSLKTEWRGKWWSSRVLTVDASLVEVQFLRCDRREWIYRGSTRLAPLYLELQAAERHRPRALPRTQPQARTNMPYVEYTRSDEQATKNQQQQRQQQLRQQQEERQRAVAKKSTVAPAAAQPPPQTASSVEQVTSRVVYYTPKNAVKPHKMTPHTCSPACKRKDVFALKDLRTYNPLAKPLLSGWERQIVRWRGQKRVMYVAPCGRRLRTMRELHRYLRVTDSEMSVDLFDYSPSTKCLAEFVLNKIFVGKKDLSHGKEIVPVPCVNYYDDTLPEFCSYNTERTPTAGVPLNLDPEFLCGCDCEDDCEDKSKCACWKMTLEGARTIGYDGDVGYVYRRLPEPLPSGIYECNSRCKCKNTCLNRVAQHPLQLKLQVFKTQNRGWGIRALNDVPKGAFLCVYAGNLLTDATANLDGLNEGDEYLAELDYIEVVEQMKEGFEQDIPDSIKAKDKKALAGQEQDDEDEESSEEEDAVNKNEIQDDDFEPGYIGRGVAEFNKRLRRRDSKKEKADAKQQEKEKEKEKDKDANAEDECITISDDEEVREPSCFTAAAGMGKNQFISKYRSVRTLFGEDEACYIMDAKVQGNIGRYLNHSCTPNVFVQNVFVDTHDPRFPWVAFFALHHIRAGTELTWNYNYDVGSVPGKVLYCFCGAPNCRGRLL